MRCSRAGGGRKEPALVVLDGDGGKVSSDIGAGIDADPVAAFLDPVGDRVAVDDDESMLLAVAEEGLADPAQVLHMLIVDRDAGANAGMDEEIVAEAERVAEAFQELAVGARHGGAD